MVRVALSWVVGQGPVRVAVALGDAFVQQGAALGREPRLQGVAAGTFLGHLRGEQRQQVTVFDKWSEPAKLIFGAEHRLVRTRQVVDM